MIIPAPARVDHRDGELSLRSIRAVTVTDASCLAPAEMFCSMLQNLTGIDLPTPTIGRAGEDDDLVGLHIELGPFAAVRPTGGVRADGADPEIEHHRLIVTTDSIGVTAASPEGVYRALTTLLQTAVVGDGIIPCVAIDDAPAFAWRGLSLDVVRTFVPREQVERVIDMLSIHKLNVLHLHLTDNEAWRLHIESRPRLTEMGERGVAAGRPGGHYTQDDFRALVAYAADRYVTIVPEIDLPGHAQTALAAYPELALPDAGTSNVDPSANATWRFVDDVIRELAELSPSPYVHIGGDEAFGMPDGDHSLFIEQMVSVVATHGKQVVGWQEICRAELGTDVIVQHWITPHDLSDEAVAGTPFEKLPAQIRETITAHFAKAKGDLTLIAQKGVGLLLSPTEFVYLDRPHGDQSTDEQQDQRRMSLGLPLYPPRTLQQLFEWDPIAEAAEVEPASIIGVEAAVWCETVETMEDLELLLLPRLAGVAEVAWSADARSSWEQHRGRLAVHAHLYRSNGWTWYRATSVDWITDD